MKQFGAHIRETREGWATIEAETVDEAFAKANRLEYYGLESAQSEVVDWHVLEIREEP